MTVYIDPVTRRKELWFQFPLQLHRPHTTPGWKASAHLVHHALAVPGELGYRLHSLFGGLTGLCIASYLCPMLGWVHSAIEY